MITWWKQNCLWSYPGCSLRAYCGESGWAIGLVMMSFCQSWRGKAIITIGSSLGIPHVWSSPGEIDLLSWCLNIVLSGVEKMSFLADMCYENSRVAGQSFEFCWASGLGRSKKNAYRVLVKCFTSVVYTFLPWSLLLPELCLSAAEDPKKTGRSARTVGLEEQFPSRSWMFPTVLRNPLIYFSFNKISLNDCSFLSDICWEVGYCLWCR